jgi:hypothetical protein
MLALLEPEKIDQAVKILVSLDGATPSSMKVEHYEF